MVQLAFVLVFVWSVFPLGQETTVFQRVFAMGVPFAFVAAVVAGCVRRSLRAVSVVSAAAFGIACYSTMWIGRAMLFAVDELEGNILSALVYSVRKVASFVHKSFSVSTEYGLKLLMFELVSPMVLIVLLVSASVVLAGRHHKGRTSGV
ncbi:MAG: hypothetical protein ACK515_13980 [bacterium]|nr:hypothetical protein [Betaproteobacteria bacterium]